MKKILLGALTALTLTTGASAASFLDSLDNKSVGVQMGVVNGMYDSIISSRADLKLADNFSIHSSNAIAFTLNSAQQNLVIKYNINENLYVSAGAGYEYFTLEKRLNSFDSNVFKLDNTKSFDQATFNVNAGFKHKNIALDVLYKYGSTSSVLSSSLLIDFDKRDQIFITVETRNLESNTVQDPYMEINNYSYDTGDINVRIGMNYRF